MCLYCGDVGGAAQVIGPPTPFFFFTPQLQCNVAVRTDFFILAPLLLCHVLDSVENKREGRMIPRSDGGTGKHKWQPCHWGLSSESNCDVISL